MQRQQDAESSNGQRACDACKSRKVKCDKQSPCSNCKSSGSACRTTNAQHKEQRSRVIISKEYEKKIDRIGDRLASIEDYLKRTPKEKPATTTPEHNVSPALFAKVTPSSDHLTDHSTPLEHATWDASNSSHSVLAGKVVEQAIGNSPAFHDPEIAAVLSNLKDMLGKINESHNVNEIASKQQTTRKIAPPTRIEMYEIVQAAESSMTMMFYPFIEPRVFGERCQLLLNHPRECSTSTRITVYGLLGGLATELGSTHATTPQRYQELAQFFYDRLDSAISDIRLITPPSREMIEALQIAASCAVDQCRPNLSQSLASAGTSMCVQLGYHRFTPAEVATKDGQAQQYLFWMFYMMDHGFAISLGRTPVVPDWDITVSTPKDIPAGNIFMHMMSYWIEVAQVQGQVVEQLFSPAAMQLSHEARSHRASSLMSGLHEAWQRRVEPSEEAFGSHAGGGFMRLIHESDNILHHSLLTLIQQAVATMQGGESAALQTARTALQISVDMRNAHNNEPDLAWAAHSHWVLLHAPITPFTVTFCHIIANPLTTQDDLRLLGDYVAMLKSLSHISEGLAKFHRLCSVFDRIAGLYAKAKAQEVAGSKALDSGMQPAISDIDGYLSAIGFAPPVPQMSATNMPSTLYDTQFDANYLNDWYSGNNSLIGLLDQDVPFPQDLLGYMPE